MKLTQMQKGRRVVQDVEYAGELVEVTYLTGPITPAFLEEAQQAGSKLKGKSKDSAGLQRIYDMVQACVAEWDITDEDGELVPVTAESMRGLPLDWLVAVVTKVGQVVRPPARKASGATSEPTD